MEDISWKLIDKYFKDNPYNLVAHHLESYDDFFQKGINRIFRENNPIRFIEREDENDKTDGEKRNQASLYLGGKNGDKLYFGKPVIYDDNYAHYMYPNHARLRNMTYGITIHYDVDVELTFYENDEKKEHTITLEKIYLGRFPVMLQSNLCILKGLSQEVRFNMGECRNDYGGYFIIDGKEKVIVSQEKFADNMLYIRENKADDLYSHSAEIRSVSEDASKPIRTTAIKIVAPSPSLSNNQIVVAVPNVKKPVPLFILMRALGVESDKSIIEHCLLDIEKYESYVDLFIPSIHDARRIFNQETALRYIATFTKRRTISGVLEILMNYFLPHIGEENFLDKAYFVGYMVNRLLRVFTKKEKPTDRDNFRFKRVELSGSLIYDLFREYYLIQNREIAQKIDKEYYYHTGAYKSNFISLIENNFKEFFKERVVESGFRKAFKGNWGSEAHTKRLGVIQDVNRLSWNSFISQMRKFNLPLDASAKVVGPRLLHSSQWGYIDPVDTPDGGNIGLHKHMAISTLVTSGTPTQPFVQWLRAKTTMRLLQECTPLFISTSSKVFVNGTWVGVIDDPIDTIRMLKLFRRNGVIPVYTSVSFQYDQNEIYIYTDAGRLTRPIYYIDGKKVSYNREDVLDLIKTGKFNWEKIVSGFKEKGDNKYNIKTSKIYEVDELYPDLNSLEKIMSELQKNQSVVEYVDTAEEEGLLIATRLDDLKKSKYYTHIEIDPSLILGILGNLIIYAENNPYPRDAFSCGQSKQAVSMYHSNHQVRIDKMGVVLNYGQIPLIKSKYLEYINNEQQPYGENAIVAIMCYTGYNVEDAILINEGSLKRGIFRTTYYSMYEAREESSKVSGSTSNSHFADVSSKNVVGIKPGYDYGYLDKHGLIKENTPLDDKIVVIGKVTSNSADSDVVIDSSVFPKKGQLGYVDKAFITEGEEGFRIAKIRIREERVPAIGDKMASRAGQKGTLGLIIPEEDMPFTADGVKPDLIINPHAIPSRMTIGQLLESVLGKACVTFGGFGDCTAFSTKGANTDVYGSILVNAGFHSSGNQVLYNGMTGEQIYSDIFIGPTYYMRLKHMVKDKINYRALGPRTMLTRQTVQGRANDGGLRIGEMERDGIMAHGASAFLNESFMIRGDEYYMAVCNKTGCVAVYNSSLNLFVSPFADGPLKFNNTLDGKQKIQNISRFGRSFSIVRIPYALKLLMQELQVMNVQMRIITEDNIDQLMSMSYSDNVNKLLKNTGDLKHVLTDYKFKVQRQISNQSKSLYIHKEPPEYPENKGKQDVVSPPYPDVSPAYSPGSSDYDPGYNPTSPPYNPESPIYHVETPPQQLYSPRSPEGPPPQQLHSPHSPEEPPPQSTQYLKIKDSQIQSQFDALPDRDKALLLKMLDKKRQEKQNEFDALPERDKEILLNMMAKQRQDKEKQLENLPEPEENIKTSILEVEEPVKEKEEGEVSEGSNEKGSSDNNEKKTISFDVSSASEESSEGTKTIKL
jgi:DNA-directed RNA polymerase II subunit RPB2